MNIAFLIMQDESLYGEFDLKCFSLILKKGYRVNSPFVLKDWLDEGNYPFSTTIQLLVSFFSCFFKRITTIQIEPFKMLPLCKEEIAFRDALKEDLLNREKKENDESKSAEPSKSLRRMLEIVREGAE